MVDFDWRNELLMRIKNSSNSTIIALHIGRLYKDYSDNKNWVTIGLPEGKSEFEDGDMTRVLNEHFGPKVEASTRMFPGDAKSRQSDYELIMASIPAVIYPYSKAASLTVCAIRDGKPFSLGAQAQLQIKITKVLNSDGTYNTEYSSEFAGTAPVKIVYDAKGKIVGEAWSPTTSGADAELFAKAAEDLWAKGYNREVFHKEDSNGNRYWNKAKKTVREVVIKSQTDQQGVPEFVENLNNIVKCQPMSFEK
ncbi:MAG: hypothetical protein FWE53_03355 [Firmicutes bacterium]|nr:hypothetical protein [Bacillota bacterium]